MYQNYQQDSVAPINSQIKLGPYASSVYLSMSYYFNPEELCQLPSPPISWAEETCRETDKAVAPTTWPIFPQNIKSPDQDVWECGLSKRECVLHLERRMGQSLLELHTLATEKKMIPFKGLHWDSLPQLAGEIHQRTEWTCNQPAQERSPGPGMESLLDRHTLRHRDNES